MPNMAAMSSTERRENPSARMWLRTAMTMRCFWARSFAVRGSGDAGLGVLSFHIRKRNSVFTLGNYGGFFGFQYNAVQLKSQGKS